MELNFLDEITESRLFRYASRIENTKIETLAVTFYVMMLMLHILRFEDDTWAREYVAKTLQYNEFTTFRSSASDMHNVIAVITDQGSYEFAGGSNAAIGIPLLGLKRYMRDIQYQRPEKRLLDNSLFLDLESNLKLRDSQLRQFRRTVMYWKISSKTQKRTLTMRLSHILSQLGQTNDMLQQFKKVLRV